MSDLLLLVIPVLFTPYLLVGILVLTCGRKQKISRNREYRPTVTVFTPTFNEEKYIRAKLDNLLSQTYPVEEIIIYDCSTDQTPSIVESYQKKYPVIKLVRQPERIGPARTFNQGLLDAKGELVMKSDADVMLKSQDAIRDLVSVFSNSEIGGACAIYVKDKGMEKYHRKIQTMIQIAESNIDSAIIAHPGLLAFRKSAVSSVDPNSMAEDAEEFILVRKKGFKAVIDVSVETEEEVVSNFALRRKQRDRRAQGVIKAIVKNKDVFLNPRYGKYGFIIFPMEIFILTLSPFFLLAIGTVSAYVLYLINPLFLGLLAVPLVLLVGKSNILFAALDTQLSGLVATFKVLFHKDEPLWSKVR